MAIDGRDPRQTLEPVTAPSTPRHTSPRPATAPKQRPDPRPMRLALGAGAFAAVSIMTAGLIRFPMSTGDASADAITADAPPSTETLSTARPAVRIKHKTVYVQLKRGQQAPRGAKVISGAVPTPRIVVTSYPAKAATARVRPATRRVVTRTRQSGH